MSLTSSSCYDVVATPPPLPLGSTSLINNSSSLLSSYGILFTLANPSTPSSSNASDETIVLSSLGFYVDTNTLSSYFSASTQNNGDSQENTTAPTVSYQVYALDGYYADPSRRRVDSSTSHENAFNGGGLPVDSEWDYRGDFSAWTLLSEGVFGMEDLIAPTETDFASIVNVSYFQIPFEEFRATRIPHIDNFNNDNERDGVSDDRVMSFYLTLQEVGALIQFSLENWESLNDPQLLLYCGTVFLHDNTFERFSPLPDFDCDNETKYAPDSLILQIGEGVVSYPFYTIPYFYTPRKFFGRIYLQADDKCPSTSPTLLKAPTNIPPSNISSSPFQSLSPSSAVMASSSSYIDANHHGCHRYISTDEKYNTFINQTSASYGIIFPVQSKDEDHDGVWITSLAFYVDFNQVLAVDGDDGIDDTTINYQVYTLVNEGFYADPHRNRLDGAPKDYDYRGNFSYWKIAASGTISKSFLTFFGENDDNVESYLFQIPWDRFEPTYVSSNGGIQSFYLTLDSASLVYKNAETRKIGKVQKDDDYKMDYVSQHPPTLLIGEGVIGYPFNTIPFLYTVKQFIGKVYYKYECPSQSPSMFPSASPTMSVRPTIVSSDNPSMAPTAKLPEVPSSFPSVSIKPYLTEDVTSSVSVNRRISVFHVVMCVALLSITSI
ncbi:hypothetical protein HJC23_008780 [Cyclotella cryptica]|uniref:Peptidase A1 domain-containing protein n=1 Tax=Cyclotella cryptica TaxID=29204 RepID=A0ABD3PSM3_9STRA|eukprot:CCRYP_012180-RA/>CCRYP_012180-RA protein AED:0.05 eAED:0.05 QI:0/-1/0/1/-1/1/1/0/662